MYNGIGLQTARGSGTNGYVQTNKFFVRPKNSKLVDSSKGFGPDQGTAGIARKPNRDILEHDRKRQIELKLTILEDKLSDQGYTDSEIMDKINEARASLEAADAATSADGVNPFFANEKNVSDTQTHQIAARKEKQLETMRAALGISLPEDKEEKRKGLADLDAHEDDDEKPRNYKKSGSEGDGEYEEGEILHRNEDGEAKLRRQKEDLVSERKSDNKGRRSDRTVKDEEDDYKHKKGLSRKHTVKESRHAHSSTDTDSDSEHDSAIDVKGKQRAQRKSKKSEPSGSDSSVSDSDDSGDAHGRRGQGRNVHKHKKNEKRKTRSRKVSESSDSDTDSKRARGTDSDAETRRKLRFSKSKKSKSKIRDYSDHSSDDLEEKHKKGRPDKLVKSHKRHDSDDSDLETKTRHGFEKSKKMKSIVNNDYDHSSDDSEREPQRWGSKKLEEGHKRQVSERDSNVEIKAKYRVEKSEKSKPDISDASDYSSDDSRKEPQRRGSDKLVKAHKRHDSDHDSEIKWKSRPEKSSRMKSKLNSDSDSDRDEIERVYQRKSGEFEKAHWSHDVDSDHDKNGRSPSPKMQDLSRHVKRGRHDSEGDESDGKPKSKRSEVVRLRYDDKEHKDDRRGRNRDDDFKRKHVDVADNRDYTRRRRDTSKSDDREVTGGQKEDDDYRKKQDRAVHEHEHRRHRQDERERGDKELGELGDRRDEKEYERKREHENDYKRQRRDDEHGNQRRGRREEDDHERRQDRDRDPSKRTRYEDSSPGDRRHRDRVHFSEDRWSHCKMLGMSDILLNLCIQNNFELYSDKT
ncbi:hypothetical protein V2J09_011361 [Rumex salicifolius]